MAKESKVKVSVNAMEFGVDEGKPAALMHLGDFVLNGMNVTAATKTVSIEEFQKIAASMKDDWVVEIDFSSD